MHVSLTVNGTRYTAILAVSIGDKNCRGTKNVRVSGGKKCLFFGNFGMFCFLETPVLRFALLPYYQRFEKNFYTD